MVNTLSCSVALICHVQWTVADTPPVAGYYAVLHAFHFSKRDAQWVWLMSSLWSGSMEWSSTKLYSDVKPFQLVSSNQRALQHRVAKMRIEFSWRFLMRVGSATRYLFQLLTTWGLCCPQRGWSCMNDSSHCNLEGTPRLQMENTKESTWVCHLCPALISPLEHEQRTCSSSSAGTSHSVWKVLTRKDSDRVAAWRDFRGNVATPSVSTMFGTETNRSGEILPQIRQ